MMMALFKGGKRRNFEKNFINKVMLGTCQSHDLVFATTKAS